MAEEDPRGNLGRLDRSTGLTAVVMRGAGYAGGGYVLAQLLNLGFYIVLARLLTPDDFGLYAAATILTGFAMLFGDSGMNAALIQRRTRLDEAANTAVIATFSFGIAFSLFALAMAPVIGAFFRDSEITAIAAAMSGIVFVDAINVVPEALLQRRFSFLRRLVIEPLQVIVFGVVTVVLAANDMGVWALVIGQYAGVLTAGILAWILARWRPQLRLASFALWREMVSYARHVLVANGILRAGQQADSLIIGRIISAAALGQFRYAYRIASTPYQAMMAAAAYVLFPAFSRISESRERFEQAFVRSLRFLSAVAMPAGLVLLPLGIPTAVLVFGDVWRQAGETAMAMSIFTGASAVSAAVAEGLKAVGNSPPLTRLQAVITGASVAGMLAGATISLPAVGAGLSAGAIIGSLYALRLASLHLGSPALTLWREIWPSASAALLAAALVLPLDRLAVEPESFSTLPGLALLFAEAGLYVGLFAGLLRLIRPGVVLEAWELIKDLIAARRRSGESAASGPA